MKRCVLVAVVLAVFSVPVAGWADTIKVNFLGNDPAGTAGVDVYLGGSKESQSNWGGIFKWKSSKTPGQKFFYEKKAGYGDDEFLTFCIGVNQHLIDPGNNTVVHTFKTVTGSALTSYVPSSGVAGVTAMTATTVMALQKLWGYELPKIKAGDFHPGASERDEVAAMQLAIWEVANDVRNAESEFHLTAGKLTVDPTDPPGSSLVALANTIYTAAMAYTGPLPQMVILTKDGDQDQITALPPVPEPTSFAAWGLLGLLGLMVGRRVRDTKSA